MPFLYLYFLEVHDVKVEDKNMRLESLSQKELNVLPNVAIRKPRTSALNPPDPLQQLGKLEYALTNLISIKKRKFDATFICF